MTDQSPNDIFHASSFMQGHNAEYLEQMYARYASDPNAVDAAWQEFFRDWDLILCPTTATPAFPQDQSELLERTLDVDGERSQRRDVEHAESALLLRHLVGDEAVERVEERREGLARAGGRGDEDVLAPGDGGPTGDLGRGRLGERRGEPLSDDRGEVGERLVISHR